MTTTKELAPVRGGIDLNAAIAAATSLGNEGVMALKELYAIAKEERAANAKAAFVAAMADFRAEMPAVVKSVPGQHGVTRAGTRTKGMYAPLDSITPVLDPVAAKHGFSYRFTREVYEGKDYVLCIVSHKDGHEQASRFPAAVDSGPGRSAQQAVASGETYARRYALTAAFAITTADPDDDGNGGGVSNEQRAAAPNGVVSDEQAATLVSLMETVGGDPHRFLKWLKVDRASSVLAADYDRAIAKLEQFRKEGKGM